MTSDGINLLAPKIGGYPTPLRRVEQPVSASPNGYDEGLEDRLAAEFEDGFAALLAAESDPLPFQPVDIERWLREEPEPVRFIHAPYVPEASRVLVVGPAESSKSMWALWLACRLSREGRVVVYFSGENPTQEEKRRLKLLHPEPCRFHLLTPEDFDLKSDEDATKMLAYCQRVGADVVFFDTLTAYWSGDENDNREFADLDRRAFTPLMRCGIASVVLDHTGHPGQFGPRGGVHAARGASAKAQKMDVALNFKSQGAHVFLIEHAKNRTGGGVKEPIRSFQIYDVLRTFEDEAVTPVERIDIREVEVVAAAAITRERRIKELCDKAVPVIEGQPGIATGNLRTAIHASGDDMRDLEPALLGERPSRVEMRPVGNAKRWYPLPPEVEEAS